MGHKLLLSTVFVFALILGNTLHADAQYVNGDKIFVAGQKILIKSADSDSLIITYRPGSNISSQQYITKTRRNYEWTPAKAGIFAISTQDGPSQTVSIQFKEFPLPGFIVLFTAGIIIFGGAVFASINLFGKS